MSLTVFAPYGPYPLSPGEHVIVETRAPYITAQQPVKGGRILSLSAALERNG